MASSARRRLWEWCHGRGSHFVMHLFDLMAYCDPDNLELLKRAFPEEVGEFILYKTVESYAEELDKEFNR